jgi:hypothetical protein
LIYELHKSLAEKAAGFPEGSYGACRCTLVLGNGQQIPHVVLAWGSEIVSIGGKPIAAFKSLPFELSQVVDVLPAK